MPSDEQHIVDSVLSVLSTEARRVGEYSGEALDIFDRHINQVAGHIRDAIQGSSWIPDHIKAAAPPAPRALPIATSAGYFERLQLWTNRNRAWTAAIVAFTGTTLFLVWRSRRAYRQKRRARKASTGAKTEVVILSGSPYSPLTKSLAFDLERRGFLVYIPVGSLEEESAVAEMRVADIHSLNFDITSTESTKDMIAKFSHFLSHPQRHGTTSLHLASLILLPPYPSTHPVGQSHKLSTQLWSEDLNTHLLYPISITNLFIPLLASATHKPPASIVLISPSTIPALTPALHAAESVVNSAMVSFFATLRNELPASLSLSHVRLGALDLTSMAPNADPARPSSPDTILSTSPSRDTTRQGGSGSSSSGTRHLTLQSRSANGSRYYQGRGRHVRELQNAVFDCAVGRSHGTVFVGRGARTYVLIGALAPRGLVSWLMGSPLPPPATTPSLLSSLSSRVTALVSSHRDDGGRSSGGKARSSSREREGSGLAGSAEWEKVDEASASQLGF